MIPRISEQLVAQISIVWSDDPTQFLVQINFAELTDPLQRVVAAFLYIGGWRDIRYIAENVAKRTGFGLDMRGYSYPNPNAPEADESAHFDGVNLWSYGDIMVNLSEPVFTRMISRLLTVVIDGATQTNDPAVRESWWPDLLHNAQIIAKHVAGA